MADVMEWGTQHSRPNANSLDEPARGQTSLTYGKPHRLDSEESRRVHAQLLQWYYYERDRQATNRLEMAIDHDFYDGIQWSDEDADKVEDRKQMPLVYNEVAPMCDWLIGTERRNRVDWSVLPRGEEDVDNASVKTKAMKYVADVNRVAHNRSRAFADCIKGGEAYVDDGVRDDPTQEVIYSRYEDWRNVIMDSSGLEITGDDARYVFRWRWVDSDIAMMMFPDRRSVIARAVEEFGYYHDDPLENELEWNMPQRERGNLAPAASYSDNGMVGASRSRVRLIEAQFRRPARSQIIASGPLRGAFFDPRDRALVEALNITGGSIVDRVMMRVHAAVFTEESLLALGPSPYRHNKFSLTRLQCYRRSRDRQAYGVIRRVRGVQQDLNKRASKALWLVNTNQIIADRGAVEDVELTREEAQQPDGYIEKKAGAHLEIRRDTDAATGQLQLMAMAAQSIQKSVGVNDDNLGRKTNAESGEAIRARQNQGAVSTTEPFDNLRLCVQAQGEKQLSLLEQFWTEEKVIRITGAKGKLEWVKVNTPELQPDGSVRWLNDITSSMADFVVSEADYAGTLRQVMFESMQQVSQRLPPEIAVRFLRIAFEFSDLPNKDEIVEEIRRITGEADPDKKLTPEEAAQAEEQMRMQAEAMQVQREAAMAALQEQQAKVREIDARVEKTLVEIDALQRGDGQDAGAMQREIESAVRQVREQAATQIEQLSQRLAKLTADNQAAILKIKRDADTAQEVANIDANAKVQVAQVQKVSDRMIEALERRLEDLGKTLQDVSRQAAEGQRAVAKLEQQAAQSQAEAKAKEKATAQAPAPAAAAPAAAPAPAAPVFVLAQPSAPAATSAKATMEQGADGAVKAVVIKRDDGTELRVDVATVKPGDAKNGR